MGRIMLEKATEREGRKEGRERARKKSAVSEPASYQPFQWPNGRLAGPDRCVVDVAVVVAVINIQFDRPVVAFPRPVTIVRSNVATAERL